MTTASALLALIAAKPASATPTTVTFNYTGAAQTWTVPAGVTSIAVDLSGAEGGFYSAEFGGLGGRTQATLVVAPGDVLQINAGGHGAVNAGGFNGGGASEGPGGGGASDVRKNGTALTDRIVVAGGGGGSGGDNTVYGTGGSGGQVATAGAISTCASTGGGGGTQSAGGAAGTSAQAGSLGLGGAAQYWGAPRPGGGGGGYYGGGGGGGCDGGYSAGGGGGSSWAQASATNLVYTTGVRRGDGQVVITYPPTNPGPVNPPPGTQTFNYTGGPQWWTVPDGVTSIAVDLSGAQGGFYSAEFGGLGGRARATLAVTPGDVLQVNVGGAGNTSGWNGGGYSWGGPIGGGASDIRRGGVAVTDRAIVAGGGGGSGGDNTVYGTGGSGGQAGTAGGNSSCGATGGGGGTQSGGGTAGTSAQPGSLGLGGNAQGWGAPRPGGGGGGYYGGGGGGGCDGGYSAGGGGGSSWAQASATNLVYTTGVRRGDGQVVITYPPTNPGPVNPPPGTQSFNYTGGPQWWTVPDGVTSVAVDLSGGEGGFYSAEFGGLGGRVRATLPVTPGDVLQVDVGGAGNASGWNGGGYSWSGPFGGGASDIRRGGVAVTDRIVVAGGGGGSGGDHTVYGTGGSAGQSGTAGANSTCGATGGGGATQSAGGTAGTSAQPGSLGLGGNAQGWGAPRPGGGGGGYYGGGGGGGCDGGYSAGGGGGSNWVQTGATAVKLSQGVRRGNGGVTITWPPALPSVNAPTPGSQAFGYLGTPQWWTVPDGVTTISVDLYGAQGGYYTGTPSGGQGGRLQATLAVSPGDVLQVDVGGAGNTSAWNGGGYSQGGPLGGGESDVRLNGVNVTERVAVAAGGGGTGGSTDGGAGGGLVGGNGLGGSCGSAGGMGATQSLGGSGFGAGIFGLGGSAQSWGAPRPGGGGGGYYGGGGGGGCDGGYSGSGGGGSSWASPNAALGATTTSGVRSGDGQITISWPAIRDVTTALGDDSYGELVGHVHVGSGNLVDQQTDVSINTAGPDLELARSYNSLDTVTGAFGTGWNSTYEIRAALDAPTGNVTITYPDGRRETHTHNPDGSFTQPPGFTSKLTAGGGGGWTLTSKDRTVETFGSDGRLLTMADNYGRALTLNYTGTQLTSVVDPASGRSLSFSWVGSHITAVSTNAVTGPTYSGPLTWQYRYTGDLLERVCDPRNNDPVSGYCRIYTYDTGGKLTSIKEPKGNFSLKADYYPDRRAMWTEDGATNRTNYLYGDGVTQVTDPRGFHSAYFYDLRWRTTQVTDPQGGVTTYTYDANGFRNSVTDPMGNVGTMVNDANGNQLSQTDAEGKTSWFTYDGQDNVLTKRDPRSASATDNTYKTAFTYNSSGDELTETSPSTAEFSSGVTQTTTYTNGTENYGWGTVPAGLVRSSNPGRGGSTLNEYDSAGDLRRVTAPSGLVTTYTYDALGRRLTQTVTWESGSAVTTTTYDQLDDELTTVEPAVTDSASSPSLVHQRRTTNTYDANGNATVKLVDDVGGSGSPTPSQSTTLDYDNADRLWRRTDPESGQTSRTFDANSNVATVTDAQGRTFRTDYDALNRAVALTLLSFVDDPVGGSTPRDVTMARYAYDAVGRKTSEFRPAPGTGGRSGQLDPNSTPMREVRFSYDRADRLLTQTLLGYHNRSGVNPATRDVTLDAKTYDAAGNVLTEVSGGGLHQVTNVYDQASNLSTSTLELGATDRVTTYSHDELGDPTVVNVAQGSSTDETRYAYDATTNWLSSQTIENGTTDLVTTYTYDRRGLRTSTVDPRGNVSGGTPADYRTDSTYDALGELTQAQAPPVSVEAVGGTAVTARPTATYGYDAMGNAAVVLDPRGNRTKTTYDRLDRKTRVDYPAYTPPGGSTLLPSEVFNYDHVGNLTSSMDRRGKTTDYTFDGRNRVVRQLDPQVTGQASRGTTLFAYDDAGNKVSMTDPTGALSTSNYDDLDRLRTSTSVVRQAAPAGSFATTYDYDDAGNQTYTSDPTGVVTSATFDGADERTTVTDALNKTTTYAYDVASRLLSATDPLNRRTEHVFDPAGRETSTIARDANTGTVLSTSYADYDVAGNRTGVRSERSSGPADSTYLTSYAYNALNQPTSVVEPGSGTPITTSYGHDANGNVTRVTDGRGNATTYTYNPWDLKASTVEPSTTAHPNLVDRTFSSTFDAGGLPLTETQPGVVITRTFDELARLTTEAGAGTGIPSASRTFGYDLAGRRTSMSHPSGTIGLAYDDRGLLLSATVPGSATIASSFLYDPAGRMTRRTDASGVSNYTYTPRGELDTEVDPLTGKTANFDWNDAGQLATANYNTVPATTRTYAYDTKGRLDVDTLKAGSTTLAADDYSYDAADNVVGQTITASGNTGAGAHTYAYDRSDRLASWTKGATTTNYTYDASGNRTQAGANTYTYDQRNRLTAGPTSGSAATTYAWSARGTMASLTKSGKATNLTFDALDRQTAYGSTTYTYDGLDRVAKRGSTAFSYAGTETDPAAYGTELYARSPAGDLEALKKGATARLVGEDRHGDLAWLMSTAGAVTDTSVWDPYGTSAGTTGSTAPSVGFQDDFTDPTSGFVDMGARWYQPGNGTFTARDSAFGELKSPISLNRYTYANADPLGMFDPDGHSPLSWAKDRYNNAKHIAKKGLKLAKSGAEKLKQGGEALLDTGKHVVSATVQTVQSTTATVTRTVNAVATTVKRRTTQALRVTTSVLTTAAKQGAGFVRGFGEGAVGMAKGLVSTAKMTASGVKRAVTDPRGFARDFKTGLGIIKKHPGDVAYGFVREGVADWRKGNYGEALGHFTFDIAATVGGGRAVSKGLEALGSLGKASEAAEAAGDLSRAGEAVAGASGGGARFAVDSSGVARDLAPDVQGLARMHAEEILATGARPTMSSAAFDTTTGDVYFGESGAVPSTIDPRLAARTPSPSLEPWPAGNCAEFNACNAALLNGASAEDLIYGTVRTRTGLPEPPCLNCQVSLDGATYAGPKP